MNKSKENRLQWHPACFAALNLEFLENRDDLEFLQEQTVNELPLRIDALIIKKTQNCKIKNEIGEIFRWYNLVEYKSPDDELSFNTFLKGIAEVYLYKIKQEKTRIDSYTLSFIRTRKPVVLFGVLKKHGFSISEKYSGIYYVSGRNLVPIQIVVSSKISGKEHIWLNSLTKKLSMAQAKELVTTTNELEGKKNKEFADAVWEIVTRSNKELIEKMREENIMCKAMAEIFKPEIDAAVEAAVEATTVTVRENACNDKGMQVFKNMIKRGFSREDAQAMTEISDELVERALAEC